MTAGERGISYLEIIIILAIFMVLVISGYLSVIGNLAKGRDAKRKSDLRKISVAFENYLDDKACYPEISLLQTCGGQGLSPYLNDIPCDPLTKKPYLGQAGFKTPGCNNWFKIYSFLENVDDPIIANLGLGNGETVGGEEINYGVSSGNVSVADII
ncbi:hypothetical protein KKD61_02810 [Patescibacteria group bacterium]|nr:hypothetical protein [Patescibacteria group bacterium]